MSQLASLHARDVTYSQGRARVLEAVELDVTPGRRIGLIGPNGVGKSTLLRVLAGELRPERGTVTTTPPTAAVAYLPQERERRDELASAYLARRTGVAGATAELHAATSAMAASTPGSDDRYADALDRWLTMGAADFEGRVEQVWASLGLSTTLLEQPMPTLSGGEAARAGLAALELSRFDVYLLDEPTNDLDLDSLQRLETWVKGLDAPVVLVSHDRRFLDHTVTHVAEFDEFTHRLSLFAGGWQTYLDERAVARRHDEERYDVYASKRADLSTRAQREREWATLGLSRAKKKPADNDKNIKAFKINQTEQLAGRAARTERAIERLEVVDKPMEAWQLRLTIASAERSGAVVCELDDVVLRRGSFVLGPITLAIDYGERVAIVGSNGSGKTTLLDVILGRVAPDRGRSRLGAGVRVGEIEQTRARLPGDRPLLNSFLAETGMTVSEGRTLLAKFGIGATHVERPVSSLSPGERTRAVLALLMAGRAGDGGGANCLVFDEPTNHLDLPAIEQLEQAIDSFPGTVLLVTHDRALLDHVKITRTVRLDGGRIVADTMA